MLNWLNIRTHVLNIFLLITIIKWWLNLFSRYTPYFRSILHLHIQMMTINLIFHYSTFKQSNSICGYSVHFNSLNKELLLNIWYKNWGVKINFWVLSLGLFFSFNKCLINSILLNIFYKSFNNYYLTTGIMKYFTKFWVNP